MRKGKPQSKSARLAISKAQKTSLETYKNLAIKSQEYLDSLPAKTMPTTAGLALHLGITKRAISYQLENPDDQNPFYNMIELVKLKQEEYLLTNAIVNKANSKFAMYLLTKSHAGYEDKPAQLTQNNNFHISPDLLADALQLMDKKKPED